MVSMIIRNLSHVKDGKWFVSQHLLPIITSAQIFRYKEKAPSEDLTNNHANGIRERNSLKQVITLFLQKGIRQDCADNCTWRNLTIR